MILFQELHDGAENTFREDQLERILSRIGSEYVCRSEAFYWKSNFVPHPKIWGSVGMKLATISKYKISDGIRHSLPLMPADPISTQFNLKRAILQNDLPIEGGDKFTVLNTHLDAFSQGTDTMHRQVETITGLLKELDLAGHYWVLGEILIFSLLGSIESLCILMELSFIRTNRKLNLFLTDGIPPFHSRF